MDSKKIQELALNSGLIDVMRSEKTGRYFISANASLTEVLLFPEWLKRKRKKN